MQLNSRLRDFVLYVTIGVVAVGGFLLWLTYVTPYYTVDVKWPTLAYFTAFLFGMVIRAYWHVHKSQKFWIVLAVLFGLHVLGYILLLLQVARWPPIWYPITFVPEMFLICVVIGLTTRTLPSVKKRGPSIRETLGLHR